MKKLLPLVFLLPTLSWAAGMHDHHLMQNMEGMGDHDMSAMEAMPEEPVAEKKTQDLPAPTEAELKAAFPDLGGMDMRGHMADNASYYKLMLDKLEAQDADPHAALAWDAKAWWGRDLDKLWLKSEGEREAGRSESLETQLYWGHAFARWWESTLGLRQDGGEGPSRTWAAIGIQGLAPYFFESNATVFIGGSGRTALRLEGDYDLRITNRLILQPSAEMNFYGRDDSEAGWGRGWASTELGLRLRYELHRKFAPYIGVEWSRLQGRTADMARADGRAVEDGRAVAGVRIWF